MKEEGKYPLEWHVGEDFMELKTGDPYNYESAQQQVFFNSMQMILENLGMPMDDENFKDTPKRWLKVMAHYLQPFDPAEVLGTSFEANPDEESTGDNWQNGIVIVRDIPYRALCSHHLLPVLGKAQVAYIPGKRVVGISKLARLVYGISHRMPSLQEHVGAEVAKALEEHLAPVGVAVIIDAQHTCMTARGVEEPNVSTVTSSLAGVFRDDPRARQELYALIQNGM